MSDALTASGGELNNRNVCTRAAMCGRAYRRGSMILAASDVGMCGDPDGVIGFEKNSVLQKIVYGTKTPFEINDKASKMINAVLLEIDEGSHKARSITPIHTIEEASHE